MISTQYPTAAEFEDAVHATAYMATALLRRGELMLPPRIREHIADGPVVVHLLRGEDDVARYEATLTAGSKLVGIDWPEDVLPQTGLTVLCPRGGASHDIGVVLPDANVDWPDTDLPATPEPVATPEPEPEPEPEPAEEDAEEPTSLADTDALVALLADQLAAEPHSVETPLPGPVEYEVPTDWRDADVQVIRENGGTIAGELDLPADPWAEPPTWPGHDDLAAGEVTETFTAVLVPTAPDIADPEPGTVYSQALVAVRTPAPAPRRAGWLERRVREGARLVLDRSWTATRVIVATASGLVLAGAGLGHVVLAVFQ